jgi:hypothetical protein
VSNKHYNSKSVVWSVDLFNDDGMSEGNMSVVIIR